jgi:hypothetical protein
MTASSPYFVDSFATNGLLIDDYVSGLLTDGKVVKLNLY